MGRGGLAPVIQAAFGKPVPVAAHPGGGAWINAAAVPMADGRADDHPEEISQAGGTAGIHGMTLCKTEKFSDSLPAGKNVPPYPCKGHAAHHKRVRNGRRHAFPSRKGFRKQHRTKAASAVLTIGIMTDTRQRQVRKNPVFMAE